MTNLETVIELEYMLAEIAVMQGEAVDDAHAAKLDALYQRLDTLRKELKAGPIAMLL